MKNFDCNKFIWLIVFCLTLPIFQLIQTLQSSDKWFQIYYGILGAFYIAANFRSMSPLEYVFQVRIEWTRSKRVFAYPLEFFFAIGVVIRFLLESNVPVLEYIVLDLVHIIYVVRLDWLLICSFDHGNSNWTSRNWDCSKLIFLKDDLT